MKLLTRRNALFACAAIGAVAVISRAPAGYNRLNSNTGLCSPASDPTVFMPCTPEVLKEVPEIDKINARKNHIQAIGPNNQKVFNF